jgi:D-alanyl-D-alanine carboxypeptidase
MKRFLSSLLLLVLVGSAAIAIDPPHVALGAGSGAAGSIDSLRRPATSADSARALEKLAADIQKLLGLPDEVRTGRVGIEIRSLTRNRELYQLNGATPLTPASTTKVVTAYTALCELGGDHMVRTVLAAANRPTREGVLVGDLYVKGFGDPFFTASDIDLLVDRFMTTGIRRIEGNVVGDGSYFDGKTRRVDYSGDDDQVVPLPPITALTINGNVFTVLVSAPSTPGQPLNVQTVPRSSGFDIVCDAVSAGSAKAAPSRKGRSKSRSSLVPSDAAPTIRELDEPRYGDEPMPGSFLLADADGRRPSKAKPATKRPAARDAKPAKRGASKSTATKPPSRAKAPAETVAPAREPARGLKVSVTTGTDGRQTITVTGSLAVKKRASYRYEMKSPEVVIAGMVHDRLLGRGIAITGRTVAAAAPARIKTLAQTERPLIDILSLVMKNSNNYLAEYVFKMIGAHAGARSETARASVQRISARMSTSSVSFDRCIINDGSGLSRNNLLSAQSLAGILAAAHRDKKIFQPLYSSMSVAGVDGTLRKRLKGTLAEGNVHGKTGTLRNVSALTGYVTTRDGELLAFAMLMNGGNLGSYRSVQDKIAQRLADFSYRPQ